MLITYSAIFFYVLLVNIPFPSSFPLPFRNKFHPLHPIQYLLIIILLNVTLTNVFPTYFSVQFSASSCEGSTYSHYHIHCHHFLQRSLLCTYPPITRLNFLLKNLIYWHKAGEGGGYLFNMSELISLNLKNYIYWHKAGEGEGYLFNMSELISLNRSQRSVLQRFWGPVVKGLFLGVKLKETN